MKVGTVGRVTFSIDGYRLNQADTLRELRESLEVMFIDADTDATHDAKQAFNELACQVNSFNCVHVEGLESFNDLSNEPDIELFDI